MKERQKIIEAMMEKEKNQRKKLKTFQKSKKKIDKNYKLILMEKVIININ